MAATPPPDDQQPQVRKKIRLIRLEDPYKAAQKNASSEPNPVAPSVQDGSNLPKPECQKATASKEKAAPKNDSSEPKPVTSSVQDRSQMSTPKCQEASANKECHEVQQYSNKAQTKADVSQLAGFLRKRSFSDHTSDVIKKTSHTSDVKPVDNKSSNSSCSPVKKAVLKNESSVPKPVTSSCQDKSHLSKPKCQKAMANKESREVQQYSNKAQTKADVSQLAGFLRKRSFSDVIKKTNHTCDDKPVINKSRNSSCLPVKEISRVQDSVPCDLKHRTVIGPVTKPLCLKAEKVFDIEPDNNDYSLDLMGDYTLKVSDHKVQRPPPNVSLDTTHLCPQQFISNIDLGIVQETPQDHDEYDIIMNSSRGYTYINYSKHRGIKRRVVYDDEEVAVPCKRQRTC